MKPRETSSFRKDSDEGNRKLAVACKSPGTAEIFLSVQGEGRNSGQLRTFLRLSGCNLQCIWCDTPYTWNWEGTKWPHIDDMEGNARKYSRAKEMVSLTVEQLAARMCQSPAQGIVITGGEPLVQMRSVTALARRIKRQRPALAIEIETNGTIAPSPDLIELVDLFMVSPKLEHAKNRRDSALRSSALMVFASLSNATFKIVAETDADVRRVADLARRFAIPHSRIYIMPLGTRSDEVIRTGAALIDSVISLGFNYSDRLHIHLFGDRRGT
jgi:7-carboxy-7-deazaguanine synthase